MPRIRGYAGILLALFSLNAMAQTKTKTAAPKKARRVERHPDLQSHREDSSERPQGHRRADGIPEHRLDPDPGADGIAQRGRARQVGLRALLRAHDVPRHEGLPRRQVPGDPDEDRRAAERVHDRRLHELPHDLLEGRPRPDAEDRGRPVHEPRLLRGGLQDGSPRGARRVQQEQRQSDRQDRGGPARRRLHDPHLQAHHDGLHQGHRGHAEPVRVLEELLRPLVPARVHDHHRRGRRRSGEGDPAMVEKYWGGWKRGDQHRRDPGRAAAQSPRVRPRALVVADASLGDGRLPRSAILRDTRRTSPPSTCFST